MAGERGGRDDVHGFQPYPPFERRRPGWEPEADGYPDAGYAGPEYPADQPAPDYPSPDYPSPDYPSPDYPAPGYPAPGYPTPGYPGPGDYRPGGEPTTETWPREPYPSGPPPAPYQPGEAYPPEAYQQPEPYPAGDRYPARDPYAPPATADPYPPAGSYPPTGRYRRDGAHAGSRDGYDEAESSRGGGGRRARRKRKGLPLWQELPLLLIIAFCLAVLVRTFLLQAFYIPSGSMEDTLIAGDRVLVNKVVYHFRDPARGEVVVFEGTDAWAPVGTGDGDIGLFAKVGRTLGDLVGISRPGERDFIKRVIGLPGDTVSCCDVDGRVFVNGQPLDESYVVRDSPLDDGPPDGGQDCRTRRFDEVVVQPGQIFVMGDHRQVSQDSRCQGQVPIDNVIGRAFLVVWPSSRWSSLPAPDTFDTVPQPAAAAAVAPAAPGAPAAPAQLALVLPVLVPVGWTIQSNSARFRPIGRAPGRRLAG